MILHIIKFTDNINNSVIETSVIPFSSIISIDCRYEIHIAGSENQRIDELKIYFSDGRKPSVMRVDSKTLFKILDESAIVATANSLKKFEEAFVEARMFYGVYQPRL